MTSEDQAGPPPDPAAEAEERVARYASEALDALPEPYAGQVNNVQFFIQRTLTPEDRERLRLPRGELYGLYEGVPLTRRGRYHGNVMPDRITIYWGPLVRNFPDDGRLADKVRRTVYHELAHYFGMSEDDLAHTSVK